MAQLPVPGRAGPEPGLRDGSAYTVDPLADAPRAALGTLIEAGHEAVLVGGCVRDLLLGERRDADDQDWDLATSATPDVVAGLFAGSRWENRFGTVTLPGSPTVEITSYRTESGYRDRRRPDDVQFGTSLADDLARRDFTINAIAWRPTDVASGTGLLVDPHGGLDDLGAGIVRAVGDPAARLAEDALRILRGIRFSQRFGFRMEPDTERALSAAAPAATGLSAERVRDELLRLLGDRGIAPSRAFAEWERLGVLRALLPELAALRGVSQGKRLAGDALDHSLRTADALPSEDPILRLAGLLHDLGKASTEGGGRFLGHDRVGAELAGEVMRRLRFPERDLDRVTQLVRHHMFGYTPSWTDAAVRRFIARVGLDRLDDLFALRAADDAASGTAEPSTGVLDELRSRIELQRASPLELRQLAVDGHAIQRELGIGPGPVVGEILARLMERVIEEPRLNERDRLLAAAHELRESIVAGR